jgi:hypothetical protein
MVRQFVTLVATLGLFGCGVPDYFDQHPSNVRDASAIENYENSSAPAQPVAVAATPAPAQSAPVETPPGAIGKQPTSVAESPARVPAQPVAAAAAPAPEQPAPVKAPPATITEQPAMVAESPAHVPAAPAPQRTLSGPPVSDRTTGNVTATPIVPAAIQTPSVRVEATNNAPAALPDMTQATPNSIPQNEVSPAADSAPIVVTAAPVNMVTPVAAPAHSVHCEAVAEARAEDAAANGKDDELQRAVHDGTYAECAKWEAAHPGSD